VATDSYDQAEQPAAQQPPMTNSKYLLEAFLSRDVTYGTAGGRKTKYKIEKRGTTHVTNNT